MTDEEKNAAVKEIRLEKRNFIANIAGI